MFVNTYRSVAKCDPANSTWVGLKEWNTTAISLLPFEKMICQYPCDFTFFYFYYKSTLLLNSDDMKSGMLCDL